jgi:hypothetical protein
MGIGKQWHSSSAKYCPNTSTVQAPHPPWVQLALVPVRRVCSRKYSSNVIRGWTEAVSSVTSFSLRTKEMVLDHGVVAAATAGDAGWWG